MSNDTISISGASNASSSAAERMKEDATVDPRPTKTSNADSSLTADFQRLNADATQGAASSNSATGAVGNSTSSGTRFRILRPHARGGLGQVSVAQDEELSREVALKEIQGRFADDLASRSRFVLEAEITGRLEHPGIVPVYGLGQYADGRPFYAMRFIRGQSLKEAIDEFHRQATCDQRSPAFRKLLGRFIDVCNAIQYAHDRGVLHRDLKPANIMLGQYGETLVVDWGLAKVMAQPDTRSEENALLPKSVADSSQTLPGLAIGTPGFLSPEQAAGNLEEVGPASDIYSLGATLYCLATGKGPMAVSDENASNLMTMLVRVQKGDFPRPRQVKADVDPALEAIILKAMALRPGERYASARKLADDLEQWLADEPVSAWTEPWSMRARRWIGRHRTVVTGIAAAVVVGLISLVMATVLLTSANRNLEHANQRETDAKNEAVQAGELAESRRQDAEAARKSAEEDAAAAVQIANFMGGLFEQADPFVLGGHFLGDQPLVNPSALNVVERGAGKLADRRFLSEKPLVRANLLDKVGHVFLSLGEGGKAEPFVLEALDLRKKNLRGDHEHLASSLHNVGFLHLTKGNLKKSADLFEAATAMRARLFGADSPPAVTSRFHLALALSFVDSQLARSESLLLDVLARQQARLEQAEAEKSDQVGKDALECVCTLVVLCNVHQRRDELVKVLPRFLVMKQTLTKVTNKEFAAFIDSFFMAQQMKAIRQPAAAEKALREALAILEKRVGKTHYLHTLLERDLGTYLYNNGRDEDAEKVFLDLVENYGKNFSGDASGLATVYSLLASSIERGSLARAWKQNDQEAFKKHAARLRHFARAAFEHGKKCDIDWYEISMYGTYLAETHLYHNPEPDLLEAERAARECWDLRRERLGAEHELCGHPFRCLLTCLARQNKSEEIEKTFLELMAKAPAPNWRQGESGDLVEAAAKLAETGRGQTAVLMLHQALRAGAAPEQVRNHAAFRSLRELDSFQGLFRKKSKTDTK